MVYFDDIIITTNNITRISQLKKHLFSHFQIKDLGYLKYFPGIEVMQSKGVIISQKKYVFHILEETDLTNCKPIDSSMNSNQKLMRPK